MFDEHFFEVTDDKIPDFWIFKYFKYNNLVKNQKHLVSLVIDMYIGPKELIEDSDFIFDVLLEPADASRTLYNTLLKYDKEWKTPYQT